MTPLVIDASVAVKWYVDEVYSADARRLASSDYELIAPDLLFIEVASALWKRIRREEMTAEDAEICCRELAAVPISIRESRSFFQVALRLAAETATTVYDGLYLALALHHGCLLVTADRKLRGALQQGTYATAVLWVGNVAAM